MNKHHCTTGEHRTSVRRFTRAAALVLTALALSLFGAGTASAQELPELPLSPTQPIDGFVDHWYKYHYGEPITNEIGAITGDPEGYVAIHEEMLMDMLGQGGH